MSTALVAAGLAMALSVLAGWDWPLLGGARAGIIALAVLGLIACVLGSPLERSHYVNPFGLITSVVAMGGVTIAVIGGLIFGGQEYLLALMLVTIMLWALATVRHAVEGVRGDAPPRLA